MKIKRYYSDQDHGDAYKRSAGHCWYCGLHLERYPNSGSLIDVERYTLDHIVPISQGGTGRDNLVISCSLCNSRKGTKTIEQFRSMLLKRGNGRLVDGLFWFERQVDTQATCNCDRPTERMGLSQKEIDRLHLQHTMRNLND